jgi:hypothetical protein
MDGIDDDRLRPRLVTRGEIQIAFGKLRLSRVWSARNAWVNRGRTRIQFGNARNARLHIGEARIAFRKLRFDSRGAGKTRLSSRKTRLDFRYGRVASGDAGLDLRNVQVTARDRRNARVAFRNTGLGYRNAWLIFGIDGIAWLADVGSVRIGSGSIWGINAAGVVTGSSIGA